MEYNRDKCQEVIDCFNAERLANKQYRIFSLEEMKEISQLSCPNAGGFEGPDTFAPCGHCIVCRTGEYLLRNLK